MGDADNIDVFLAGLRDTAAKMLQIAALTLQQAALKEYTRGSNPPPYTNPAPKDTYPHVRTGFLAKNLLYRPTSLSAIRRELAVRVGYGAQAFYGIALGKRGWKWMENTLDDNRSAITSALGSVGFSTGAGGIA